MTVNDRAPARRQSENEMVVLADDLADRLIGYRALAAFDEPRVVRIGERGNVRASSLVHVHGNYNSGKICVVSSFEILTCGKKLYYGVNVAGGRDT